MAASNAAAALRLEERRRVGSELVSEMAVRLEERWRVGTEVASEMAEILGLVDESGPVAVAVGIAMAEALGCGTLMSDKSLVLAVTGGIGAKIVLDPCVGAAFEVSSNNLAL